MNERPRKDKRDDRREYPRKDKREDGRPYQRKDKREDGRPYPRKDKREDGREYPRSNDKREDKREYSPRSNYKRDDNREYPRSNYKRDDKREYPRSNDKREDKREYSPRSNYKRDDKREYPRSNDKRDDKREYPRSNDKREDKREYSPRSNYKRDDKREYPRSDYKRDDKREYPRSNDKREDKREYSPRSNYKRDDKREYSPRSNYKRDDKREYPRSNDKREDKREYSPRSNYKREDKREYPRSNDKRDDKREYSPRSNDKRPYSPRSKDKRGGGARQDNRQNTRHLVLKILSEFDSEPGDPERIADRVLARRRMEDRDRRFVFEIVYGVLRNRIYLDYVIAKFITGERELLLDNLRRILQIGAYQIIFLDRVPDHAAVNEAVELAKKDRDAAGAAGLVNAVLRNVIKNKFAIELPDSQTDLSGRLSVEFSHPRWMVERWLAQFGLGKTRKILAFDNERPAIWLRRRMRGLSRQQFEFDVRTLCEPAEGYLNLYYKMKKALDPEDLRLLQNGFCVVQAPSSGWAVAMLDLRGGERVADLCCAPGGKTTLMAELVGAGTVAACDRARWKLGLTAEASDKLGLKNVYPILCDSTAPPFKGRFDSVLVDAPCSGTGVLQRHPDGRFVRTADDIANIVELQKQLLDSAAGLVKDGGTLVYSTCSLEEEENGQQVERFLSDHPDFKLVPPPAAIPVKFVDDSGYMRITPFEHGMDGMFGARFKKD